MRPKIDAAKLRDPDFLQGVVEETLDVAAAELRLGRPDRRGADAVCAARREVFSPIFKHKHSTYASLGQADAWQASLSLRLLCGFDPEFAPSVEP